MHVTSDRRAAFAIAAVALCALAYLLWSGTRMVSDPEDFRAFYCAGRATLAGADPYLAEPLRACEVREALAAGLTPYRMLAVPAPLPGYALAPFALTALLPFAQASTLDSLALICAVAMTIVVLSKLVRYSPLAIAASLALSLGLTSLTNGQLVPFAVLALCASGLALQRGRFAAAAACAALAAIEPHVALPAWLALFYAVPRARVPLSLWAAGFGVMSLVLLGVHTNVEYLTQVLPVHARSELGANGQYSLTTLLHVAGIAGAFALTLGNASYLGMTLAGVVIARRAARALEAPALLALLPPAFAVVGGPFVHLTQIAVAIPALWIVADRAPFTRARALAFAALALLALPWLDLVQNPALASGCAIAAVTGTLAVAAWKLRPLSALGAILALLALGALEYATHAAAVTTQFAPASALASLSGARELAEATWTVFVDATQRADPVAFAVSHAPTWLGLALLLAATFAALRSPRDRGAGASEV